MASDGHEFTELLQAHARGDRTALDRLFPKVYDELRQMARGRMRHERADHTLGATRSQNSLPSGRSPATGRALRSAWNSQVLAHFS